MEDDKKMNYKETLRFVKEVIGKYEYIFLGEVEMYDIKFDAIVTISKMEHDKEMLKEYAKVHVTTFYRADSKWGPGERVTYVDDTHKCYMTKRGFYFNLKGKRIYLDTLKRIN